MSDDRPSIAELQRLEQRMESAPWDKTTPHAISNAEYDLGRFDGPADAIGVVALRNAAPVLLEIAAAALAWAEVRDASIGDAYLRCPAGPSRESQQQLAEASLVLVDVLAKVKP